MHRVISLGNARMLKSKALKSAMSASKLAKRQYFGPCKTTEKTFDKILIANRGESAC
ncbi:hypothetical protein LPJ66_010860, partial [Kickxella alabastrina]